MSINRRAALKLFAGGLAVPAAGFARTPAYFSFFNSPVRLDRYTRTTFDLVSAERVAFPSPDNSTSLKLMLEFSKRFRYGTLVLDLAPVKISKVCFQLFNPDSPRKKVYFRLTARNADRKMMDPKLPRVALPPNRWIKNEVNIQPDANAGGVVLMQLFFRFEVDEDFPYSGEKLPVYLSGVECF